MTTRSEGGTTVHNNEEHRSTGDAAAIVDVALAAGEPKPIDEGEGRHIVLVPAGGAAVIVEPIADKHREFPRRVQGSTTVLDADSLAVLWAKHAHPFSEIYADPAGFRFTAVLNADVGALEPAGFRDHRIELALKHTVAWSAWTGRDGRLSSQEEFAEFLEDRQLDIVDPSGATMLELAQSFQATTKADFKGAVALQSSTRALQYVETTTAAAGQKGQIEIPSTFQLGLVPFEGSDAYRVTARFRYRIRDGHLQIGYRLERPEDVLRKAFDDVRDAVSEATGQPVLLGSPPAPRG